MNNLTADKAGLSTNYEEWAGKSQIVIPLAKIGGGLSTIDTSVISDKKVVESMQEEDDKGVDERKKLVDFKEREAEEATEKAQTAQKKVTEEAKKLSTEKKVLDEVKKKVPNTTVYIWSGYTYEDLQHASHPKVKDALALADFLIDGPYIEE
jgi:FKBP-type peptidyl-prolyl cis-trans isomerase